MKRLHSLLVVAGCMILAVSAAYATETTVDGTGAAAVDLAAVQSAVNLYDVVNLRGAFNFGTTDEERGGILILRSGVTLRGEPSGTTVIAGGGRFDTDFWTHLVVTVLASDFKAQDLTFDGPKGATFVTFPAFGDYINNFESKRVRIINPINEPYLRGEGSITRAGWCFYGTAGLITIRNCEFVATTAPVDPAAVAAFEHAVNILFMFGATLHADIEDNLFAFAYPRVGRFAEDVTDYVVQVGTPGADADEAISATISGNTIRGGLAVSVLGNRGRVEIEDNAITATYVGVAATTAKKHPGFVIDANRISMVDGLAAILSEAYMPFTGRVWASNMEVTGNTMVGTAEYGVYLHTEDAADPTLYIQHADRNLFTGNVLTGLVASEAYYYFGKRTEQNSVPDYSGDCGAVVDYGAHNFISGCEKNSGQAKGKVATAGVEAASWGQIKSLLK